MPGSKVIVITGTSSGIGLHTAVRAARRGHTVIATMRDIARAEPLQNATREAGVSLQIERLDVQEPASILHCVETVLAAHGRIDVLVNNAGFGSARFLEQSTEEQIRDVFDVNVYGVMRCIQAVLPHMRKAASGHILTVSSVGGLVGQPMNEVYCAAKFAVEGLVESMATYCEPYFGVKMSLVEPAGTKTEFVGRVMADLGKTGGIPSADVYGTIASDYLGAMQSKDGLASRAQEAFEVADVILGCIESTQPVLRNLTSKYASAFCQEKLTADPTGDLQVRRIRASLLGK